MAMVLTNNSPSAGYVAWSGVVITFKGTDYNITNGNSNKKFIWWDFTNPNALQVTDTLPILTDDDCVFLLNIAGVHYLIPGSTEFRAELVTPINAIIPTGVIVMWSGSLVTIPTGWLLCDGANGTPNLRDRFVIGAGTTHVPGATGGEATHTLSAAEMPVHTHTQNAHNHTQDAHNHSQYAHNHTQDAHVHGGTGSHWGGDLSLGTYQGVHVWRVNDANTDATTATNQAATASNYAATATNQAATASNQNAGSGGAHENRPPYYALAYIMKS